MKDLNLLKNPRTKVFDLEISGPLAMFGTPTSKQSCEMISYPMPTYSALCGIMRHIYYRPGIKWEIEKCRIMNEVDYYSIPIKAPHYKQKYLKAKLNRPAIFVYSYLQNVRYQIRAFYVVDKSFFRDTHGYCSYMHDDEIDERIMFGPEKMVWLGKTHSSTADIRPCRFGEGEGYYDSLGRSEEIYMFHSFIFDKNCWDRSITDIGFCRQYAENGVIDFSNIDIYYQPIIKAGGVDKC